MVLVEVRAKKAAFLREAGRQLQLLSFHVATETFSTFATTTPLRGRVDVVTIRAVRLDEALWRDVSMVLAPAGVVLWFGFVGDITKTDLLDVLAVSPPVVRLGRR